MAGFRSWLRRLSRKSAGGMVRIEQIDGTTKTFAAEPFWLGLFVAQTEAATGETPTGPVADAVHNATPRERERLEALAASGRAGDFMRGSGHEDERGLLEVADDVEDLSEPA
jgi:hypothetical protein